MFQYKYPHPAVTTDIVIFTIRDNQLKLLLIMRAGEPFKGKWALPGGFVTMDESLDEGARRELEEETGVSGVYLEQLYTFGAVDRDPRERVITVAYYALIPSDKIRLQAATDAEAVGWFSMDALPELAFDHQQIVAMAQQRLAAKLDYSTIAFQFMPEEFTLSELQLVYEIILQEEMDRRNFRKWVLALEQIEETGNERREGAHRPAKLYRVIHPNKVEIIK
ncbi:MAG: NUDIX hydrolase [Gammaproteobacteria bacterium]|nr:NUDIX hydrolase [Gammaproteobacteria bacterium]MDH5652015.1 NUDIX hydrolase [Gammaproteobacteria bacterium]